MLLLASPSTSLRDGMQKFPFEVSSLHISVVVTLSLFKKAPLSSS